MTNTNADSIKWQGAITAALDLLKVSGQLNDAILGRVAAGTMPCDKAWAPEKVSLFRQWAEGGTDA